MMKVLFSSLVDGVLLGFVYGLASMGLSLIWGVMQVVNLAHGALMVAGMFGTYLLFQRGGVSPYAGLPLVVLVGLVGGLLVYWLAVHRVVSAPHLSSLLSTFSVDMILIGVGTIVFTASPRSIDYSPGSVSAFALRLDGARLIAAAAALALALTLFYVLRSTRAGKAIRAVTNNRVAAEIVGIPTARVLALSFAIGTALAVVAGALIATIFPFTILSGESYQTKAFVVCVLGGLGNPVGALAGGVVLGTLEGVIATFLPVSWVPVVEFIAFVVLLLVRPQGLLGKKP